MKDLGYLQAKLYGVRKILIPGKERKKDDYDVATSMNYVIASFSSWSESICNPKMGILRIEGPQRLLPPFEGEHLE